jgi:hypothetical protein
MTAMLTGEMWAATNEARFVDSNGEKEGKLRRRSPFIAEEEREGVTCG